MTADDWIAHLQLAPHPEGGYFRRSYTAGLTLDLPDRNGPRPVATAIFYLLKGGQQSRLHRLKSDELWHFHLGSALTLHRLDPRGGYTAIQLGADPAAGQHLQIAIPAGCWFGATVDDPAGFSLLGCTVAPGFDFADFELADRVTLIHQYPQQAALIERLT
ncbi:MAG: cupin domain-containing protein [Candidatus Competibacter sp.]